jgi:hypothetical protein
MSYVTPLVTAHAKWVPCHHCMASLQVAVGDVASSYQYIE